MADKGNTGIVGSKFTTVQSSPRTFGDPLLQQTSSDFDQKPPPKRKSGKKKKRRRFNAKRRKEILIAATYIEDALHVRQPQNRIQEQGSISWLSPLKAYRFEHKSSWKYFVFIVIWIHCLLVIWAPTNHAGNAPDDYSKEKTWVLVVQFFCLNIFVIDCALRIYSHDREFLHDPWNRTLFLVISINIIHECIGFLVHDIDQSITLILQSFRPYYLIYSARSLRLIIKSILRSVPRIMMLLWVIAFTICAFGLVGWTLMRHIEHSNFNTFEQALLSLMILLTTANFPDVMMPAYNNSQYYVLFFTLFVIIILVLFLPTLLAVIYESYNSQTEKAYGKIVDIHREALTRAFELLTAESAHSDIITKQTWQHLMKILRKDIDSRKHEVLFTTLRLNEEDLLCHPSEVEYRLLERPDGITREQFLRLPEFMEITFSISPKAGAVHALIELQAQLQQLYRNHKNRASSFGNKLLNFRTKLRMFLLFVFSHPLAENIIDWMVWLNALMLVAEKCAEEVYNNDDMLATLTYIHTAFLLVFVVEVILKMYAYGYKAFISDWFFIFDSILVACGLLAVLFVDSKTDSALTALRTLRLLRIVRQFPNMRLLWLFFRALSRSFVLLLMAQFCVFYVFAQIGMLMFDGTITRSAIQHRIENHVDELYWEGIVVRFYWLNNMNSFVDSMIVLLELTVVNNWQDVMGMYIKMTNNHYYRIYFITFYFCSVIVVLNVVIAFVINLFLVNYSKNFSSNDLLFRYKRYIIMSIFIHQLYQDDYEIYHWKIDRRVRQALWYQVIFEDQCNQSIERINEQQIDYDEMVQMPWGHSTLMEDFDSATKGANSGNNVVASSTMYVTPGNSNMVNTATLTLSPKRSTNNQNVFVFDDFGLYETVHSTMHGGRQSIHDIFKSMGRQNSLYSTHRD